MKIEKYGICAKGKLTRDLMSKVTFLVPSMRIVYHPSKGRVPEWHQERKVFLFGDEFPSGFLTTMKSVEVVDLTKPVAPKECTIESLMPFQQRVVEEAVRYQSALIVSATSTGKTYMIAGLCSAFRDYKVLCVSHRERIVVQTYNKLREWFSGVGIRTGQKKRRGRIMVSTFQSLAASRYDVVLVDEAHHVAAPSYLRKLLGTRASRWYGFTGTPTGRSDRLDKVIKLVFMNNVVNAASYQEGMKIKLVCPVDFCMIKYVGRYTIPGSKERDIGWIYKKRIMTDPQRNELLEMLITDLSSRGVIVVFLGRVEHADLMSKRIPGSFVVDYRTPTKVREQVSRLTQGVIFTSKLLEEGIDNKHIQVIINSAPVRSCISVLQRLGRGIRYQEGKRLLFCDIWDQHPSVLKSQGKSRYDIYVSTGLGEVCVV